MTPRLDQAKQCVLQAIARGEFVVGEVVPPVHVLAQRASCSSGTIQSALRALAQEGIVKRVRRLGTVVARQPAMQRICFLLSLDSHTNILLQQAIHDLLVQSGYAVDIVLNSVDVATTISKCRQLRAGADRADFLVALSPELQRENFRQIAGLFPYSALFSLGGDTDYLNGRVVTPDQQHAARIVVEHLLKLGHRKVAVAAGGFPNETGSWAAESATACEHLLEIAGGEFIPHYTYKENAEALMRRLRDIGATAYWALNDHSAVTMLHACQRLGLKVPEDISIVGRYDTPWSVEAQPQLTTVSINAQASARSLLRALETMSSQDGTVASQRILVRPELIVRASTARPV